MFLNGARFTRNKDALGMEGKALYEQVHRYQWW